MTDFYPFRMDGWLFKPCGEGTGVDVLGKDGEEHMRDLDAAVRWVQTRDAKPPVEAVRTPQDDLPAEERSTFIAQRLIEIQKLCNTNAALEKRLALFERGLPSRFSGTPEEVHTWLRQHLAEDTLLKFYQWVGHVAVGEAVYIATDNVSRDPVPEQHRYYTQDTVYEFFELIDPGRGGGPFPSKLPEVSGE